LAKSQRAAGHRLPSPSPSQPKVAAHPLFFFDRAPSLPSSLSNRLSCSRLPFNSQTAAPPSSLSFLSRSNKPIAPQSRSPSPPHRPTEETDLKKGKTENIFEKKEMV